MPRNSLRRSFSGLFDALEKDNDLTLRMALRDQDRQLEEEDLLRRRNWQLEDREVARGQQLEDRATLRRTRNSDAILGDQYGEDVTAIDELAAMNGLTDRDRADLELLRGQFNTDPESGIPEMSPLGRRALARGQQSRQNVFRNQQGAAARVDEAGGNRDELLKMFRESLPPEAKAELAREANRYGKRLGKPLLPEDPSFYQQPKTAKELKAEKEAVVKGVETSIDELIGTASKTGTLENRLKTNNDTPLGPSGLQPQKRQANASLLTSQITRLRNLKTAVRNGDIDPKIAQAMVTHFEPLSEAALYVTTMVDSGATMDKVQEGLAKQGMDPVWVGFFMDVMGYESGE